MSQWEFSDEDDDKLDFTKESLHSDKQSEEKSSQPSQSPLDDDAEVQERREPVPSVRPRSSDDLTRTPEPVLPLRLSLPSSDDSARTPGPVPSTSEQPQSRDSEESVGRPVPSMPEPQQSMDSEKSKLQPAIKDMISNATKYQQSELKEHLEKLLSEVSNQPNAGATLTGQEQIAELSALIKEEAAKREGLERKVEDDLINIFGSIEDLKAHLASSRLTFQTAMPPSEAADVPLSEAAVEPSITELDNARKQVLIPTLEPYEIFHEVEIHIRRILSSNSEVGPYIIIPDPLDDHSLFILGVNVEKVKNELQAVQNSCTDFTVEPIDVEVDQTNHLPHYYVPLVNCVLEKKQQLGFDDGAIHADFNRTCQLFVSGDHVNNRANLPFTTNSRYGVTVAHAFLRKGHQELLRGNDKAEDFFRVNYEMLRSSWNCLWHLRFDDAENALQMVQAPLISFRDHFESRDKFIQDMALCEVLTGELDSYGLLSNDATHSRGEEIRLNSDGLRKRFGGIFPIRSRCHLKRVAKKKVIISTGREAIEGIIGKVCENGNESRASYYGLHIVFATNNRQRLGDGCSGSIVYVVDKEEEYVYIIGMVVGVCEKKPWVYQAIALDPCLEKLKQDCVTSVRNIELLNTHHGPAYGDPDKLKDGTYH